MRGSVNAKNEKQVLPVRAIDSDFKLNATASGEQSGAEMRMFVSDSQIVRQTLDRSLTASKTEVLVF